MLVELIGPSGCGKSTVARLLDEPLAAAGVAFCSFDELERLDRELGERSLKRLGLRRILVLAPLFWQQPRLYFGILAIAVAHGPPFFKRKRRARRLLGHLLFLTRLEQQAQGRVIVLHEGFFQRLWSLVIESRSLRATAVIRAVLAEYHARFRPIAINLVLADEIAAARVFTRQSRGRFNRDSSPKRRAEFARWLDYRSQMLDLLPPDAITASIEADDDPATVASRLAEVITRLAEPARKADA